MMMMIMKKKQQHIKSFSVHTMFKILSQFAFWMMRELRFHKDGQLKLLINCASGEVFGLSISEFRKPMTLIMLV